MSLTFRRSQLSLGEQDHALPLELWLRIFDFTCDPAHLWTQGRRVCKTWRKWIPKSFATRYLQDHELLKIRYGDSRRWSGDGLLYLIMIFDRFDADDASRCIFAQDLEAMGYGRCLPQGAQRALDNAWKALRLQYELDPQAFRGRSDDAPHVISLDANANDTELPALQLDAERREISYEWEGMFDAFFREAAEQDKRCQALAEDLNVSFSAGMHHRLGLHEAVTNTRLAALYNLHVIVRKKLRRTRVARLLEKPVLFETEDKGVIDREHVALQRIIHVVGARALLGCFDGAVRSGNGISSLRRG